MRRKRPCKWSKKLRRGRTVEGHPFAKVGLHQGAVVMAADVEHEPCALDEQPLYLADVADQEPVVRPSHALRAERPGYGAGPPHVPPQRAEDPRRGQRHTHAGCHHPDHGQAHGVCVMKRMCLSGVSLDAAPDEEVVFIQQFWAATVKVVLLWNGKTVSV